MIFNPHSPKDRKEAIAEFERLLNGNREFEMFEKGEKRRNKANRLYWAWMKCLEDETGQDKNDYHDFFKGLYLGTAEKEVLGIIVTKEVSTATLKVRPFYDYMQKIQVRAAEDFNCTLPLPEDEGYKQFVGKYHWFFD
jgi:hypothetical protein